MSVEAGEFAVKDFKEKGFESRLIKTHAAQFAASFFEREDIGAALAWISENNDGPLKKADDSLSGTFTGSNLEEVIGTLLQSKSPNLDGPGSNYSYSTFFRFMT